jgi:hypothetical protein
VKRQAALLLTVLALALGLVPAATADSATHHLESGDFKPFADMTRAKFVNGTSRFVVDVELVDLRNSSKIAVQYDYDYSGFVVEVSRAHGKTRTKLKLCGEDFCDPAPMCRGVKVAWRTAKDRVRISVPHSCHGADNPSRAEYFAVTTRQDGSEADYADASLRRG